MREERLQRLKAEGLISERCGLTPRDSSVPAWKDLSEEEQDEYDLRMSVYASPIDRMDQGIGRILDKIKERGEEENTLVLSFTV